jgi:parallel beta-helix repeat protein
MHAPLRLLRSHRSALSRSTAPLLAGLMLAALAVAPASATGRTYYVATNGNDSNSGTITRPWRSFHASLRKLRAGDTLYVRGGSYSFRGVNYTSLAGTSTNRILISAYPGERPVFTGQSTPAAFLYFRGNSAYLTLRGLTVQGGGATSDSNGSSLLGFIENAHNIRIERFRLNGSSSWSAQQHLAYIAANSVNDIVFKWSTFDGRGCKCAGLLHFYHDPSAATVRVYGNTFKNADQLVMIWANVSGLKIWGNSFSNARIGIRHAYSRGTIVTDNRASSVRYPVNAQSTRNLSVYGNSW